MDHTPVTATPIRTGRRCVAWSLTIALLVVGALTFDAGRPDARSASAQDTVTTVFEPIDPVRLADTRQADCGCERIDGATVRVVVAGRADIPAEAVSAALTITVTGATADGFATVWPSGSPRRETSNLNWTTGETRANGTLVELGVDGAVDVFVSSGSFVLIDVSGVFVPAPGGVSAGRFTAIAQTRVIDTRAEGVRVTDRTLPVPIPPGIDTDATALAITVTVTDTAGWGFATAYPSGNERPEVSIVNADAPGQTRAATGIVPIGPAGIELAVDGSMHVLVDVVGWFTGDSAEAATAGRFVSNAPIRLLDTRALNDPVFADGTRELRLEPNVATAATIGVFDELWARAAAVVANITVTNTIDDGFATAYPARTRQPGTSSINWTRDQTVANLTLTSFSTAGVAYFSFAETDLIVDVTGYFTGAATPATTTPAPNTAAGYTGESPYDLVRESVSDRVWNAVSGIDMRTVPALYGGAAGVAATPPDRIAFAQFIYQFRRSVARSVAAHEIGHILTWRWLRGVEGGSEARVAAIGGHECLAEAIGRLLFAQLGRFDYRPGYGTSLIACSTSVAAGDLANEIVSTTS